MAAEERARLQAKAISEENAKREAAIVEQQKLEEQQRRLILEQ